MDTFKSRDEKLQEMRESVSEEEFQTKFNARYKHYFGDSQSLNLNDSGDKKKMEKLFLNIVFDEGELESVIKDQKEIFSGNGRKI